MSVVNTTAALDELTSVWPDAPGGWGQPARPAIQSVDQITFGDGTDDPAIRNVLAHWNRSAAKVIEVPPPPDR